MAPPSKPYTLHEASTRVSGRMKPYLGGISSANVHATPARSTPRLGSVLVLSTMLLALEPCLASTSTCTQCHAAEHCAAKLALTWDTGHGMLRHILHGKLSQYTMAENTKLHAIDTQLIADIQFCCQLSIKRGVLPSCYFETWLFTLVNAFTPFTFGYNSNQPIPV